MKRVAALYLPHWPIERLRRAEPNAAPPEPAERKLPRRSGGWRSGARWARDDSRPSPEASPQALPPEAQPLVTSIREANRSVIAAACPHALALGVRPGMALTQARIQTPGLDIRPADPKGDGAALAALAVALARRYSPIVAIEGGDTLFLELTGVDHLFGSEPRMARRLTRLLARLGYTARIAIADTPGAAWALAHFSVRHPRESGGPSPALPNPRHGEEMAPRFRGDDGIRVCPSREQAEALAALPTEALRIDPAHIELLRRLGIDRTGQLTALPRAPLVKRFGQHIATRLAQALGELPEPLTPVIPPEAIAVRQRFAEPIATPEAIEHWLGALVPRLAAALEQEGLGARAIECVADRIDGVPQRIRIGLARPNRDPSHLLRLLKRRIEDVEPGYGIDTIALHVRRAVPLGPQPLVERLDEETAPDLAELVDTLATRIGPAAMWRMRPVESDIPERAVTRMPVLDAPERGGTRPRIDDVNQLDRNPALHPWHPAWPKPVRLLRRPERIDHVLAELPDHAPRRFSWRGRSHTIVHADGPERIHGEWWKRDAERDSIRDYFRVEDEAGRRYWLFRHGDGERTATGDLSWYLHGVFG